MSMSQFALFAELEDQLRAALNAPELVSGPTMTKTALKKLAKAGRRKATVVQRPLRRSFAHIILTASKPWGGKLVRIDYQHTSCSMFEAQLAVDKMLRAQNLVFHALIKKEVCEDALS